jgi:hypothetical protein
MSSITPAQPFTPTAPVRPAAEGRSVGTPPTAADALNTARQSPHDTSQDTVTLSNAGGHRLVNLGRGQDLAQEIRNAPVDSTFAAKLFDAGQDIFRITRLFGQTVKSIFQFWR